MEQQTVMDNMNVYVYVLSVCGHVHACVCKANKHVLGLHTSFCVFDKNLFCSYAFKKQNTVSI